MAKSRDKTQFGDFQTPADLADHCCELLISRRTNPVSVLEPTCGIGTFLAAAAKQFKNLRQLSGVEINPDYVKQAQQRINRVGSRSSDRCEILCHDFFTFDWDELVEQLPQPLLIVGNPPWVTNSELSSINSGNLPEKSNIHGHRGIDAITGKGNFDISEWMIWQAMNWLSGRSGTLAMLCKTSVVRKVLKQSWKDELQISDAAMYQIDARKHFDASVDACFFVADFKPGASTRNCDDYPGLESSKPATTFGVCDGQLVSDVVAFEQYRKFHTHQGIKWRSGVKHDCAKVMQLQQSDGNLVNGLGEVVDIEPDYLYPMLKSSDLANGRLQPTRWLMIPQQSVGQETSSIAQRAPRTWRYLQSHANLLAARGSSIYRDKPPFSIFGVGPYTFSDWKVAISGLYKRLDFQVIGPCDGKPVVFDDTCYFAACDSAESSRLLHEVLQSEIAQQAIASRIFWDDKRPITSQVLSRIDINALSVELGISLNRETDLSRLQNSE